MATVKSGVGDTYLEYPQGKPKASNTSKASSITEGSLRPREIEFALRVLPRSNTSFPVLLHEQGKASVNGNSLSMRFV